MWVPGGLSPYTINQSGFPRPRETGGRTLQHVYVRQLVAIDNAEGEGNVIAAYQAVYPVPPNYRVTVVASYGGVDEHEEQLVAAFDGDGNPWVAVDGRLWRAGCACEGCVAKRGEPDLRYEVEELGEDDWIPRMGKTFMVPMTVEEFDAVACAWEMVHRLVDREARQNVTEVDEIVADWLKANSAAVGHEAYVVAKIEAGGA